MAIEVKKPQSANDLYSQWQNEANAYDQSDGGDETTYADNNGNLVNTDYDPVITFHNWQSTAETYSALVVKMKWKTNDSDGDDQWGAAVSVDGGSTYPYTLVALGTNRNESIQTAQVSIPAGTTLSQIYVKILQDQEKNSDGDTLMIYDIWTEGTYAPTEWLAGQSDGVAGVAGVTKITKKLAGTTDGVAAIAGIAKIAKKLVGGSDGVASVIGALTVVGGEVVEWLAGVVTGVCGVSGTAKITKKLVGATDGTATVSGIAKITKKLVGAVAGAANVAGVAKITKKLSPGVVFMTFHFPDVLANVLTNDALDPTAKIPEYKVCAVRIKKAS